MLRAHFTLQAPQGLGIGRSDRKIDQEPERIIQLIHSQIEDLQTRILNDTLSGKRLTLCQPLSLLCASNSCLKKALLPGSLLHFIFQIQRFFHRG
jgi:hypothetical protein